MKTTSEQINIVKGAIHVMLGGSGQNNETKKKSDELIYSSKHNDFTGLAFY